MVWYVKGGTSPRNQYRTSRSRCEHSFSPNDMKLSGCDTGMNTYKTYIYLGFLIFVVSGQVMFYFNYNQCMIKYVYVFKLWTRSVIEELKWQQYVRLVYPSRMECNMIYCLTRPDFWPYVELWPYLTRAVLGGGRFYAPPPQVFRRYLKNGGAQRRRFWHTLWYIFTA